MKKTTKADLHWWLELEPELDWQFATTYAEGAPHEYVVAGRTPGLSQEDLVRATHVIRTFGVPMKFFHTTRIYLSTPMGWKHWDMQDGLIDEADITLINRARVEHVYGPQNAPRTRSAYDSPYDEIATRWDSDHAMTEDEKAQTAALITSTFGDKLWRTLDIGCGTGLPLDLSLAEPVRYVGIDPSTAMLNALVAKYPHLAGVHPMTFADAIEVRVTCGTQFDTVLALGGSASYLTAGDIQQLLFKGKGSVLLMHYAPGEEPPTNDINYECAASSLDFAASRGTKTQIGRFITTVIA